MYSCAFPVTPVYLHLTVLSRKKHELGMDTSTQQICCSQFSLNLSSTVTGLLSSTCNCKEEWQSYSI